MAISGIQSNAVKPYICKDDPCPSAEEGATVFYHAPIPNAILTRIKDNIATASMSYGDMQTQTFQQRTAYRNREAFRFGIGAANKSWDNFATGEGEAIPYDVATHMEGGATYVIVSDRSMNMILSNTIDEVGQHIWNLNTMTETQRKNSEEWSLQLDALVTSSATTALKPNAENEDVTDQQSEEEEPSMMEDTLPEGAALAPTIHSNPKRPRKTTAPTGTGKTRQVANGKTAAHDGSRSKTQKA